MLRNFVRLLLHKCSFVSNVFVQEEYLAKMGCTDVSSQPSFDISTCMISLEVLLKNAYMDLDITPHLQVQVQSVLLLKHLTRRLMS